MAARTELGNNRVQGLVDAYTLQGWLKAVNSNEVSDYSNDMGGDGRPSNPLNTTARGEIAFSLRYYKGYYKAIYQTTPVHGELQNTIGDHVNTTYGYLFNGNIAAMLEHNPKLYPALAFRYQYDQLNRLQAMYSFTQPNGTPAISQDCSEAISYGSNACPTLWGKYSNLFKEWCHCRPWSAHGQPNLHLHQKR